MASGTTFKKKMKRYFITGFLVLIPFGATFSLIKFVLETADRFFKSDDGKFFYFIPPESIPQVLRNFPLPGFGLIVLVILIFISGIITTNIFGKRLLGFGENMINHIPLIRKIYSGIKQLINTVFVGDSKSFQRCALIEYPRKGIFTIVFVTNDCPQSIRDTVGRELVSVFLPTTPNPTSGFLLMLPREELIMINMSVEEAFKLIISGGIMRPEDAANANNSSRVVFKK